MSTVADDRRGTHADQTRFCPAAERRHKRVVHGGRGKGGHGRPAVGRGGNGHFGDHGHHLGHHRSRGVAPSPSSWLDGEGIDDSDMSVAEHLQAELGRLLRANRNQEAKASERHEQMVGAVLQVSRLLEDVSKTLVGVRPKDGAMPHNSRHRRQRTAPSVPSLQQAQSLAPAASAPSASTAGGTPATCVPSVLLGGATASPLNDEDDPVPPSSPSASRDVPRVAAGHIHGGNPRRPRRSGSHACSTAPAELEA